MAKDTDPAQLENTVTLQAVPFRVAIVGPESTGKSTLAAGLAAHYGTTWVPEFARTYCHGLARPYNLHDIMAISYGQVADEEYHMSQCAPGQLLVCDTTVLVEKVWAEHAFGTCPPPLLQLVTSRPYDLTLLCNIDLPWEPDPLREHPHKREYFLEVYKQELAQLGIGYYLICGDGPDRLAQAIAAIDAVFTPKSGR